MSSWGLSSPCPKCGDTGPFRPLWGKNHPEGFKCSMCDHIWSPRESDKANHPDCKWEEE